jgi:catechol 2,3-dioxygenase-like lactoylglutathione lyase family enzyme
MTERPPSATDGIAGFHHVALTVADLDRSCSWYGAVLGFVEVFREDGENRRAVVMRRPDGPYAVGLVQHGGGDDDDHAFDATRLGLDHVAFAVRSRRALDDWATRLRAAGVTCSGPIDVPPGAILNFRDPDGIALALFWDR